MVKYGDILNRLLQQPFQADNDKIELLKSVLKTYPYFQSLAAVLLKNLKTNNDPRYHPLLYKTAAVTTDRSQLLEWIEADPTDWKLIKTTAVIESKEEPEQLASASETQSTGQPALPPVTESLETIPETIANQRKQTEESAKMSYIEWIKFLKNHPAPKAFKPLKSSKRKHKQQLIDRFLETKPRIKPGQKIPGINLPEPEKSIRRPRMLMTETLAQLLVKQKKFEQAIEAYEILRLKYPEKNRYFANRIEEIKSMINQK